MQDPGRLVLLDGLRGVAAIGVVLFHADLGAGAGGFSRGYLFVDLFFLLSGFVLALSFEPRFAAGLAAGPFLRQRFRRFLPMVAAGLVLGLGVTIWNGYPPIACLLTLVASAAMIPLPMATMFPLNPPQWSLMIELIANGVHARWLHRMTAAKLALLAGSCALGMAIVMAAAGRGDLGSGVAQLPAGLLRAGWSYMLGIVLARVWRTERPVPLMDWRAALLAPVLVVSLLPLLPLPIWAGDVLVITAVFPLLFWIAAGAAAPQAENRVLSGLGALSFPLYAVHFPILNIANAIGGDDGRVVGVAACLLVAAGLAWALRRQAGQRRRPLSCGPIAKA